MCVCKPIFDLYTTFSQSVENHDDQILVNKLMMNLFKDFDASFYDRRDVVSFYDDHH